MQELEESFNQIPPSTPMWQGMPFSMLCRLCANSNEYLIPVLRGEGMDHQLQMKINHYLHIEINMAKKNSPYISQYTRNQANVVEDDLLPSQICYSCASTLLAFHEMKENSLEAEKCLTTILNSHGLKSPRRPYDIFSSSHNDVLQTEAGSHIPVKIVNEEDPYKYKQPAKKRYLMESDKIMHTDVLDKYVMKQPEKEHELLKKDSHSGIILLKNKKDYRFKSKNRKKRERLSKCSVCGKVFHFVEYLKTHMLSHSDSRPHLCHICGASFKRKDHVNHHRRTVHVNHPDVIRELEKIGEGPLICENCGEVKPTRHAMRLHKKRHNISSICDVCHESFRSPSLLKSHMIKVHANNVFPCDVCGEMQKSGHALYIHKKKHLTSYICDVCGKSFTQPSSLRTHMVIHSDDKPFTCDECGKSFKLKSRLHLHKQSHGDHRPFACTICENKSFKTKSALIVHNKMHNDTRPYPCPHCNFRARKNSDLICHIRTHTGEKPYKCEVCGRGFAQAGDMRKHQTTHDKRKPEPV